MDAVRPEMEESQHAIGMPRSRWPRPPGMLPATPANMPAGWQSPSGPARDKANQPRVGGHRRQHAGAEAEQEGTEKVKRTVYDPENLKEGNRDRWQPHDEPQPGERAGDPPALRRDRRRAAHLIVF